MLKLSCSVRTGPSGQHRNLTWQESSNGPYAAGEVERLRATVVEMTEDAARESAARQAEAYAAEGTAEAMEAMRLDAVGMQQRLDDSEQRADKFQRELGRRDGTAASLAQQSTLDGGVISGIDTISKVYHALKLVKDKQGVAFERKYLIDTSFQKDIADLSDRRTRALLASLEPAMMTVLGAFHPDREELLQLYAAHKRCSSSSAPRQLTFDQYAEIPIVKEAVESYKLASTEASTSTGTGPACGSSNTLGLGRVG